MSGCFPSVWSWGLMNSGFGSVWELRGPARSALEGKTLQAAVLFSLRRARAWKLLTTGPGKMPAVRIRRRKTGLFGSRPAEKPDPLLLGGPNLAPYQRTRRFCLVRPAPSGQISGSAIGVVLFTVAFRYPTVNRKILTMVHHCSFWIYTGHLCSEKTDKYAPCPILEMSIHGASTIFGHPS